MMGTESLTDLTRRSAEALRFALERQDWVRACHIASNISCWTWELAARDRPIQEIVDGLVSHYTDMSVPEVSDQTNGGN